MNKEKKLFKSQFNEIALVGDFDKIKNQIKYQESKKEKHNQPRLRFLPYALTACVVLCVGLILIINKTNDNSIKKQIEKIKNTPISIEAIDDAQINGKDIYLSYPIVFNKCDLEKELKINGNYIVYQENQQINQNAMELKYGENNFQIKFSKDNNESIDYIMHISVGK